MKTIILILILSTSVFAKEKSALQGKVVQVTISSKGFQPAQINVLPQQNLILKITRTTDKTCMTELKNLDGSGQTALPLNQETTFQVGSFTKAQKVKLLCGMNMVAGVISVND